jgi:predicted RNase H-like HicB family nuclease
MQLDVEITVNNIKVGVRHEEEADVFVGFCPRFNVYSQGESAEEAKDAVGSAICLRLRTAFDHGRIETVLRQAGLDRLLSKDSITRLSPDDEFVCFTFKEGVEVSEIAQLRVPIGALLNQRNQECQH